jgi:hypothetical protein
MPRGTINGFHRTDLDGLAEIHHHDPITDIAYHIEIMADEHIG